jgi:hypothetical protein
MQPRRSSEASGLRVGEGRSGGLGKRAPRPRSSGAVRLGFGPSGRRLDRVVGAEGRARPSLGGDAVE